VLYYLDLGINMLSGSIPAEFALSTSLKYFIVNSNGLYGEIPVQFGQTESNLKFLWLYGNQLTGPIPTQLGNISTLRQMIFESNMLTSTLPATLTNLTLLQILDVSSNLIEGDLNLFAALQPTDLALFAVDFSNNLLSGPVPLGLATLIDMQQFVMNSNQLKGNMDSVLNQICASTSLNTLVLDGLTTSTRCQDRLFLKALVWFDAFLLTRSFANQPPMCLLGMPSLQTLHMSGEHAVSFGTK
jgi:hypothetical protein